MKEEILKEQIKDELKCQYKARASIMFNKEPKKLNMIEIKKLLEDILNRHKQFYSDNLDLYKAIFGKTFKKEIAFALRKI